MRLLIRHFFRSSSSSPLASTSIWVDTLAAHFSEQGCRKAKGQPCSSNTWIAIGTHPLLKLRSTRLPFEAHVSVIRVDVPRKEAQGCAKSLDTSRDVSVKLDKVGLLLCDVTVYLWQVWTVYLTGHEFTLLRPKVVKLFKKNNNYYYL